jgi:aminomethyltransferase
LINTVAGVAPGDEIRLDVRGRRSDVQVTKPPFVPAHVR